MSDLIRIQEIAALEPPKQRADLVRVRLAIHAHASLQRLFDGAAVQRWSTERLATELECELLRLDVNVAPAVCHYVAQEFLVRDKSATLLVSAQTGLAVAQVPSEAIYVPEPVAREGTDTLATPLPRLRPEIEAAIIERQNAVAEERLLLEKLADRTHSTELQRSDGDARLHIATRSGRRKLARQLRDELPRLFADHSGTVGRLFARCRVNDEVPRTYGTHVSLELRGHVSLLVADSLAMNFRHDPYGAARERIRAAWARHLAQAVTGIAHKAGSAREVTTKDALPPGLLIGPPDLAVLDRALEVLPVDNALSTVVAGELYMDVRDDGYVLEAYEAAARWCIDTTVTVDLYLDARRLHPLVFTDLVESAIVAEVIS